MESIDGLLSSVEIGDIVRLETQNGSFIGYYCGPKKSIRCMNNSKNKIITHSNSHDQIEYGLIDSQYHEVFSMNNPFGYDDEEETDTLDILLPEFYMTKFKNKYGIGKHIIKKGEILNKADFWKINHHEPSYHLWDILLVELKGKHNYIVGLVIGHDDISKNLISPFSNLDSYLLFINFNALVKDTNFRAMDYVFYYLRKGH